MTPRFVTAADVARSPAFDPDAAAPPRYRPGRPFEALDVRPGRVLVMGGPPGAGKTTLVGQLTTGVLTNQPDVRAVVANVEMSPADLLARIAARLARVPVEHVTDRAYAPGEKSRIKRALADHAGLTARLAYLHPPFALDHLAAALDATGATLAVIDYIQRFDHGKDLRESLDGLMTDVRRLALHGAAVIVVSSVSRQRTSGGSSTYAGLNLASFRGSAELEFGADSAYILDAADGSAALRCVKSRFARPADVHLRFNGDLQEYCAGDPLDWYDVSLGMPAYGRGNR